MNDSPNQPDAEPPADSGAPDGERWETVDSGYDGDTRRIIVYRSNGDLRQRRAMYERLQQPGPG
jgi:hypothetical protein